MVKNTRRVSAKKEKGGRGSKGVRGGRGGRGVGGGVNPSYRGSCQDLHHHPISRMSLYLHSEGGVEELGGVDLS